MVNVKTSDGIVHALKEIPSRAGMSATVVCGLRGQEHKLEVNDVDLTQAVRATMVEERVTCMACLAAVSDDSDDSDNQEA